MRCKKCNRPNIMGLEWRGAYDGYLAYECEKCNEQYHANTGYKILAYTQPKEYGAVYFILKNNDNILLYKNRYLYSPSIEEDKIFDKLMEEITI